MLTESQARALTDEIRSDAEDLYEKVVRAYEGEAPAALGYDSWEAYVVAEFPLMPRLTRAGRPEITNRLVDAGMTDAEAAVTLGVSERTVRNDLPGTLAGEINSEAPTTAGVRAKLGKMGVPTQPMPCPSCHSEEHPLTLNADETLIVCANCGDSKIAVMAIESAGSYDAARNRIAGMKILDEHKTADKAITRISAIAEQHYFTCTGTFAERAETAKSVTADAKKTLQNIAEDAYSEACSMAPGDRTDRDGATAWSYAVQSVSARCPMDDLETEEVKELLGAAEFLLNYCRGELIGRKQWQ